jgi:hypothetical protein
MSAAVAMDQMISYWLFYAEAWERPRASSSGICGEQKGIGTDFSLSTFSFPFQCISPSTPYWFIYLLYSQRYIILATDSVGDTHEHRICMQFYTRFVCRLSVVISSAQNRS